MADIIPLIHMFHSHRRLKYQSGPIRLIILVEELRRRAHFSIYLLLTKTSMNSADQQAGIEFAMMMFYKEQYEAAIAQRDEAWEAMRFAAEEAGRCQERIHVLTQAQRFLLQDNENLRNENDGLREDNHANMLWIRDLLEIDLTTNETLE